MLIPFVLAAVLGGFNGDFAATPTAPEALVTPDTSPVASGAAGCIAATEPQAWGTIPAFAKPAPSAALIEAQVLEKYRSFWESLKTP